MHDVNRKPLQSHDVTKTRVLCTVDVMCNLSCVLFLTMAILCTVHFNVLQGLVLPLLNKHDNALWTTTSRVVYTATLINCVISSISVSIFTTQLHFLIKGNASITECSCLIWAHTSFKPKRALIIWRLLILNSSIFLFWNRYHLILYHSNTCKHLKWEVNVIQILSVTIK